MSEAAVPPDSAPPGEKAGRPDRAERTRRVPRYVVIVENDDHHSYRYVIEVLQTVCGHQPRRAYQLTNQVHFRGQAAVWIGLLEHAELKRDLIRAFGPDRYSRVPVSFPLGVRIEPSADDRD